MTEREAFEAHIEATTGRKPEKWGDHHGFAGMPPDDYILGNHKIAWRAWQASRQQALEEQNAKLAVLASFAHEMAMGAYRPSAAITRAGEVLKQTGLGSLQSVVALMPSRRTHELKRQEGED